jgi:hypothetical protein
MGFFKRFVKALTNPTTLIAAAIAISAAVATGGLSIAWFSSTYFTAIAITATAMAATQALSPVPKLPSFTDFIGELQGRTQMIKQPTVPRRVIYGQARVSGVLGYIESTNDDQNLHMIIMMAGHEVNLIGDIYVNDELVIVGVDGFVTSPSKYVNKMRIRKHFGSPDQSADSVLINESDGKWTDQHRLRGIAYIYVKLVFDRNAFPQGIPNVSALVQGKKVFDPRTSTTAFSANPALIVRDYLKSTSYGFGATDDEVSDASIITAANICDETVNIAPENIPFVGFGSEKRYELHGSFQTSGSPKSILENLLTSCGGIVTYTNGVFKMKVAKYVTPTITLDEGDLRGSIQLQSKRSKRDNYNAVKGQFTSTKTNYILADYPAITSTVFEEEDGGDRQFLDLDLPYTTSETMAQRLAKIALYRNRQQVSITYPCSMKGFQLDVGDTVMINNTRFGFSSKVFEVAEWSMNIDNSNGSPTLGTNLVLRELNSAVYDWDPNTDEKQFLLDNTILPNPFDVIAPSLTVTDQLRVLNEEAVSVLIADVASSQVQITDFEVEAKKSNESIYVNMGKSSVGRFELLNVEDNAIYDVRARAITRFAVSEFTTSQHQVVGKTAPPADVTNFAINIVNTEAHLSWTPVADLDLSHYRIRHSRDTSASATYANSVDLIAKVSRPANTAVVPAMTGTYFIKAVDKLGNDSLDSTRSVAIIENIKDLNLVATSTQNPSFTGSKTDVVVVDNELRLGTSVLFDSAAGNFDTTGGLFDGGGGTVASSGTYDFDTYIDVGAIYTSRVTANIVLTRLDYGLQFDDATGLFDDREGLFDGDANEFGTTNVELQVATTEDDPAGTPTYTEFRKFFVGDYKARAFKFRALLTTTDSEATPSISALSVTVDMPDRVTADNDIISGAGAKTVTFSPNFKFLQGVSISAQNLASGDYYVITSKSVSGFTITFYNSSDTAISRTFDYVAKGYGEIAA